MLTDHKDAIKAQNQEIKDHNENKNRGQYTRIYPDGPKYELLIAASKEIWSDLT